MNDHNLRFGTLSWQGDLRFTGGVPGGPVIMLDGNGTAGPGPVVALLLAAAGCSAADMVGILEKQQVKLRSLDVKAVGRRAEEYPKRIVELTLTYTLAGEGLTEAKARRAVDLSLEKYCSVVLSLNPDIPINSEIVIAG